MIPQSKIVEILKRLFEKSQANEVRWRGEPTNGDVLAAYSVEFPKSTLFLRYVSPRTGPDLIEVTVSSATLKKNIVYRFEEGDPEWELVESVSREAERVVYKLDVLLDDIEASLEKEGVIG